MEILSQLNKNPINFIFFDYYRYNSPFNINNRVKRITNNKIELSLLDYLFLLLQNNKILLKDYRTYRNNLFNDDKEIYLLTISMIKSINVWSTL